MSTSTYALALPLLVAALAATSPIARAQGQESSVTPYRPTAANPAELPAPGWLELEAGWQRQQGGSDRRRDSLPVTAKLAFSERWGVLLGTELGLRSTDLDNKHYSGTGDTTLIVKHLIGGDPGQNGAWGVEAGAKSPTASENLGSGRTDYLLTLIYSLDALGNRLDVNAGATRLGAVDPGQERMQYGWATSLSRPLNDSWGVFGELSGTRNTGGDTTRQYMLGGTYNMSKRVVLDFGMARGLTAATPDWSAFFGVSLLSARLW